MNDDSLGPDDIEGMSNGICPDCGGGGFRLGPRGGASINIACVHCGHRFNVVNMGWRIVLAQRIGDDDAG